MADPPRSLAHYIALLQELNAAPLPPTEEWTEHIKRISTPGRLAEVTEDQYRYWLEVLPPKFIAPSLFCFAEGAEPFRLFWREPRGRYLARQLTWQETVIFCRLANIPLPH